MYTDQEYRLKMTDNLHARLLSIAEDSGFTVEQVIKNGIRWQVFIYEIRKQGGSILVQMPNENKPTEILGDY